ncbi:MAG: alkane 1-monooxygenase [Immundisolibacteraceae bacterium]|nr:alkane 1-monooxygenase [Immundisolibacteraceae bacterium]
MAITGADNKMDYLRYYPNVALQLLAIAGFMLGGQWVWLGFSTFFLLIVADALSPQDYAPRNMSNPLLADLVLYLQGFLMLAIYVAFGWRLHLGFDSSVNLPVAYLGCLFTLIWMALVPNVGSAHELWHRHNWLGKWLGRAAFTAAGFPNRDLSHVQTHHLYFDTDRDYDTGQRGQSVYQFLIRGVVGNTEDEIALEKGRLARYDTGFWTWRNSFIRGWIGAALFPVVIYLAAGFTGAVITVVAMAAARLIGEAINYLQHFGLVREEGSEISDRHTWNHLSAVTRIMAFEITNHVHHHQDPDLPFYKLQPRPDGPQLRNVLLWGIAAFFPPLWARLIQPRLRDWDLNHANDAERVLAREANRKAGWPDWLADESSSSVATGNA